VDQAKAEWFLARANECLARAEKATIPLVRELCLREAERWRRLAEPANVSEPNPK
jgi:hypothetical protein